MYSVIQLIDWVFIIDKVYNRWSIWAAYTTFLTDQCPSSTIGQWNFLITRFAVRLGSGYRATWSIYVHFIYGISSQTGSNSWKYLVVSLNELIPTLWYLSKPSRKLMLSFKPIAAQHLGNLFITTRLCISYRTYEFWIDTQLLISHWSVQDTAIQGSQNGGGVKEYC